MTIPIPSGARVWLASMRLPVVPVPKSPAGGEWRWSSTIFLPRGEQSSGEVVLFRRCAVGLLGPPVQEHYERVDLGSDRAYCGHETRAVDREGNARLRLGG